MALDKGTIGAASAALTLLGLSAFAVAQPLLDVLAKHTAFLIAHSIDRFDLLLITIVLSVGPGLVAFGLFALGVISHCRDVLGSGCLERDAREVVTHRSTPRSGGASPRA